MGMVKCPFCAEEIQAEAKKCRYCSEFLNQNETSNADDKPIMPSNIRIVHEGSEVRLAFQQSISSVTAAVGDRVNLVMVSDLQDTELIFVKRGAIAVASVVHLKKPGMLGKGGELNVRLDYLKAPTARIPLRSSKGGQGKNKIGATVGMVILFGPFGLMKRGGSVEIQSGTNITAYLDEDTTLAGEPLHMRGGSADIRETSVQQTDVRKTASLLYWLGRLIRVLFLFAVGRKRINNDTMTLF